MYQDHFGLHRLPFENVPDPNFFYRQGACSRAYLAIEDGILSGSGLCVVAGPIGSGKTTLSQMVMVNHAESLRVIWMGVPPGTGEELLAFVAKSLNVLDGSRSRVFLLDRIRAALLNASVRHLLVCDEAHLASSDVLEVMRLFNNLEVDARKLLQMLLLGQDELIPMLERPEALAFKQRINGLERLGRLDAAGVAGYIRHRLQVAGGRRDVFSPAALRAIALGSGGVPRVINTLCHIALRNACFRNQQRIGVQGVYEAAEGVVDRKEIFQFILLLKKKSNAARLRNLLAAAPDVGQRSDGQGAHLASVGSAADTLGRTQGVIDAQGASVAAVTSGHEVEAESKGVSDAQASLGKQSQSESDKLPADQATPDPRPSIRLIIVFLLSIFSLTAALVFYGYVAEVSLGRYF